MAASPRYLCTEDLTICSALGRSGCGGRMIDLWLSSSTLVVVLVPFVVLYSIAPVIVWVTHKSPARPYFASCIGIAGPFFASVGILFGLFAAFLANDVQRRGANAEAAVFREADGIRTMLRLSEAVAITPIRSKRQL